MEPAPQNESSGLHFLDYWRVLRSRKEIFLVTMIFVVVLGSAITFTQEKIYDADCKMTVEKDEADMSVFSQQFSSPYDPYFYYTEEEKLKSTVVLDEVIEKLELRKVWGQRYLPDGGELRKEDAFRILQKNISIDQIRNTSIVQINVRSPEAKEAMRIANEIADVYKEYRKGLSFQKIRRSLEAMEQELTKQREKVDAAELALEKIRSEENLIVASRGDSISKQKLEEMEANLSAYRVDMISRKARVDEVGKLSMDTLRDATGVLFNDAIVTDLRRQLLDSELNLRLLQEDRGPAHPDVIRAKSGLEEIRQKIQGALEGLKAGLQADYNMASEKVRAMENEVNEIKAATIKTEGEGWLRFSKAERQLRIERGILDALQAKIAEEGIDWQIPRDPVHIFQFAEERTRPVKPNVPLNIAVAVLLGVLMGVLLSFFIEYLDTSIKTVEDLERYLGLSVIGVIPQKVRPLIQEGPDSPNAEAYRVLRTNLQFGNKGVGGGAFAVVSAGVGEGKSTTLFNLAYICARMGDKVIIVDSDMRRPVQHTILGVSNRIGLSNVLMRDVPVEEAIKTTAEPNLHFLPSGRLPRNAVGLLDSQRVRDLIKSLKARYDYVFFDSPPIMGVSDASIIASEVDGVMLVVQYRKFPRALSARAKRLIENVGGNIVGVVLNNINIMRDDYYYYYQSYYSHYAHTDNVETPAESAKS